VLAKRWTNHSSLGEVVPGAGKPSSGATLLDGNATLMKERALGEGSVVVDRGRVILHVCDHIKATSKWKSCLPIKPMNTQLSCNLLSRVDLVNPQQVIDDAASLWKGGGCYELRNRRPLRLPSLHVFSLPCDATDRLIFATGPIPLTHFSTGWHLQLGVCQSSPRWGQGATCLPWGLGHFNPS
jgi:hypothetical protein